MTLSTDKVLYDQHEGVVTITINRPEKLNALDRDVLVGLAEAFIHFDADPSAAVAILTGAGDRSFTVGIDLGERSESGKPGLGFPDISPLVNPFWPGRQNRVSKPVIAAVNGYAMGGGLYLALQADICVASTNAKFEMSETLRGCVAGWETGYLHNLPISGWAEIALGGRLSAQRAYDLGIVTEVTEPEGLLAAAQRRARDVLRITPLVRDRNLRLLRQLRPTIPQELWDEESVYIEECRFDPDAAEAVTAFLERRQPVFVGAPSSPENAR
ncbi:enoyl-CoA hydratase/isomerase family protein [Microbacterium trichothecenolyticum]|uniref:enoyl-CoA hydratase/isomerase family protein n=1 Tax=Microbacterium trichothecenolyticum TaxID=69370 RepID=UPI001C6EA1FE|nr:enoyl-CoA hydratase-related protein [Microbacterium trichothecenolyticum]MBW9122325.1 enoyl-CoA hydratase/isomerase family protein [Microbacterium trichothecenolyticum]